MAAILFLAIVFGSAFAIIAWEQREPKWRDAEPVKKYRGPAKYGKARI